MIKLFLLLFAISHAASAQESAQKGDHHLVTTKISDSLYVFSSLEPSGAQHMGLSIGRDGLTLIDSLDQRYQQQSLAAIRQLSDLPVSYGINVLIHKTGTNALLRGEGAKIIRAKDEYPTWVDPAEPEADISFTDKLVLRLNNETLNISRHRNHTLGDAIVEAKNNNVVFTGWTYVSERLPQPRNFHRQLRVLQDLLNLSNDKTIFVPASGKLANRSDLQTYRDRLVKLQDTALSLAQNEQNIEVIATAPSIEAIAASLSTLWNGDSERFQKVERDILRSLVTTIVLTGKRERPLLIDDAILSTYAGSYRTKEGEAFDLIALDGILLYGRRTEQYMTTELIPISATEFFIPYTGTKFIFPLGPNRTLESLILDRQGTKVATSKL